MSRASIIVCTRNRAESLERSLASVLLERPSLAWELVVVDNGSSDGTAQIVGRCSAGAPTRVRYVLEERVGLSHARNSGIAVATGDYLLFTDDDVLVEPGWIDGMCAAFAERDVVGAAGPVLPDWPERPPRWLDGPHAGVLALTSLGDEPRDLGRDEVPVGANMAIRASALEDLDAPFDPKLGNQGADRFAFEEHELFRRLHERGRVVYRPDAAVRHRIDPRRMTWESMRRASLHNGYGSRRAERLRDGPRRSTPATVRGLVGSYARARRRTRRNAGAADVSPDAAFDELREYWEIGRCVEELFGERPLARRVLDHAAPAANRERGAG